VVGTARPVVGAVIEVIVVMGFMMLPISKVPSIGKVIPTAKMTKVSIKVVVEMIAAEEKNRREAHVKR
jgi:hypothetical protein